jgi:hypothetical protein
LVRAGASFGRGQPFLRLGDRVLTAVVAGAVKNVVLMGTKSVTIHDEDNVTLSDLSSNVLSAVRICRGSAQ